MTTLKSADVKELVDVIVYEFITGVVSDRAKSALDSLIRQHDRLRDERVDPGYSAWRERKAQAVIKRAEAVLQADEVEEVYAPPPPAKIAAAPVQTQTKPHLGHIEQWSRLPREINNTPHLGFCVLGRFVDHPRLAGRTGWTSYVIREAHDPSTNTTEIETVNSRYTCIGSAGAVKDRAQVEEGWS